MVNDLQGALVVDALLRGHEAADPNDTWLLALADAARADYLVTGDKRAGLLSLERVGVTRILTAAVFCKDVLREGH
jgi:predicted nucleic acid-binding protein